MSVLVISYSRHDQPLVRAIVSLLKTALRNIEKAIYWDGDFEPGDPWFEQIREHIDAAPQLFVFWCWRSATSEQVRREFEYAFERHKRVVPVLLDSTPLSPELAPIHGIDLRSVVFHDEPIPKYEPIPIDGDPLWEEGTEIRRFRDVRMIRNKSHVIQQFSVYLD